MPHFADRLLAAIDRVGSPVCVGLDPNLDLMPEPYRTAGDDPMDQLKAVGQFCSDVLDAIQPYVPAVKPQIAYFESLPAPQPFFGLAIYAAVIRMAREKGFVVIADAKRGDIGSTAKAYATAHLAGESAGDALTVNGYFGRDGLQPFVDQARDTGRGLFVLTRTSNPSAGDVQDYADANGRKVFEHVATWLAELGGEEDLIGQSGYSCVGAVVGATYPDEARQLRSIMPRQIFLVPGYGAQGATAADCAASFNEDGRGAIVNASRSVIYAHRNEAYEGLDFKDAVAAAAKAFAEDIASAVNAG
jgi:orotidine-5'-phosphate decarboxylase